MSEADLLFGHDQRTAEANVLCRVSAGGDDYCAKGAEATIGVALANRSKSATVRHSAV
ncbi:MAG: hypothetical protein QOH35_2544 [Acidobacteriaceae bacterium]|nr:hypothetical protein [Acidobacteriaceae bacterium]